MGTCVLLWRVLAMAAVIPLATGFNVCPIMNKTVVLQEADIEDANKTTAQYVLISPLTKNSFIDVHVCALKWRVGFEPRPSQGYMEDSEGQVWQEMSFHTVLDLHEHRSIIVAMRSNSTPPILNGLDVSDTCTADQVSFTFSDDMQVGQYCQPSSDLPLGYIFGYVMVAVTVVLVLVVVVVGRVLRFKSNSEGTSTSAGAEMTLDSVQVNAASDMPQTDVIGHTALQLQVELNGGKGVPMY